MRVFRAISQVVEDGKVAQEKCYFKNRGEAIGWCEGLLRADPAGKHASEATVCQIEFKTDAATLVSIMNRTPIKAIVVEVWSNKPSKSIEFSA